MPEMFVLPFRPAYDSNGRFVPGAQAWFTLTGTNTESPVYSDEALTIEQPNPLVADGLGKFPRSYLDPAVTYRVRVYNDTATVGVDSPIDDHDYDPYTGQEMGSEGPQGDDGADGANATAIDTTVTATTLAPGASATASSAHLGGGVYRLSLGIPQGAAGASGALSNGTYSGIVVTSAGAALDVVAGHITLARQADIATDTVIGRQTAGTGVPEAIPIGAAAATNILDRAAGDARYIQRTEDRVVSVDIPAGAMKSRATNGATVNSANETTTNKINYDSRDFNASTAKYVQFTFAMPKSWNEGTVTAQFLWTVASGTGNVVWGIQGVSISNDAVLDAAFGTAQTVTDGVTATTDLMQSAFTSAVTIAGSPASEDLVVYQVYRDASNGSDTLTTDAKLIAVRLNFTVNAADDS